jgi:hypothetical protein
MARGNAILNQMAVDEGGGAGSGEIIAGRAGYKAQTSALTQNEKDLAAIAPYNEMLKINGNIAIDLAKKAIKTNSALANKSLNWIKQNMGDNPEIAEYLFQVNAMQAEAGRVLNNPRLVGQMSYEAKRDMDEVFNGSMPLNATERVIHRMQKDGDYRVGEMQKENQKLRKFSQEKSPTGQTTAFKHLPAGVKLSPGVHADKSGNNIEVMQDGTYRELQ